MPSRNSFVYRNGRKRLWSVMQDKKVVERLASLHAFDCTFVVRRAGLRVWRRTGHKSVHAFVKGVVSPSTINPANHRWVRVRYHPNVGHFYPDGDPNAVLTKALMVEFRSDGSCWAVLPG